jgi:hypothetical protein
MQLQIFGSLLALLGASAAILPSTGVALECTSSWMSLNAVLCNLSLPKDVQKALLSSLKAQGHRCQIWKEGTSDGPVWDTDGDVLECPEYVAKITADCYASSPSGSSETIIKSCDNVVFEAFDFSEVNLRD